MNYNKLVRDKIPEILEEKGKISTIHIANDEEYWEKLKEEVNEFLNDSDIEEMADIFEVITSINKFKHWDLEKVIEVQKEKREKRGGFKNKIILDKVE